MTSFQSRSPHFPAYVEPISTCLWLTAGGMADTVCLASLSLLFLLALLGTALLQPCSSEDRAMVS